MPGATRLPRVLTLDLMRGYFLAVIIVDHLALSPSLLEIFTGRAEMWASAAEGFFIISGLLVGYVYGPMMAKNTWKATRKIWRRAFLLYLISVALTFLFVWWGNHTGIAHIKDGLWVQPPFWDLIFRTITLQYYYGWADFLPYYAIFLVIAPLVLYACRRGLGWAVLVVSFMTWLLRGQNFELAWQLLFMSAAVAGWYLPRLETACRSLTARAKRWLAGSLYATAAVLLATSILTIRIADPIVHEFAGFGSLTPTVQTIFLQLDNLRIFMTPLIDKWTLEPVRLVTAIIWFAALYVFVRQREQWVERVTHGFFRAFGERSLTVYVIHAIIIFGLLQVAPTERGWLLDTVIGAAVIALVYTLAIQWTGLTRHAKLKLTTRQAPLELTNEVSP